jgi:multidrug efflux pump subunit AcrB
VGGSKEQTRESTEKMGGAMVMGLLGIIVILVAQFNSVLKPLVILTTIPLALIGALLGLYLTGWALGFMAMLGTVALFGVVINNAIVLIDFIETNIDRGDALRDATVKAGQARMRPILLTSLTTIGGLLPLGLFGGPLFAPLAWAMVFGLGLSTALTLLVIPTVYVLFAERLGMRTVRGE